jgi:hypothetical protein
VSNEVASRIEPAPAMFCTIIVGWPGMYRGMKRAITRAIMS